MVAGAAAAAAVMRLLGCNVYISEGRNLQLIRRLEAACSQHPCTVVLAHTFIDEPYNRTGLTLAATRIPELVDAVQAVAHHALQHIDLTTHAAQHPRLGVLDHVSLHPLGPQATLSLAAQAATAIGQQLAQSPLQLPVYFYGAAHPQYRRLAEIRRRLGYFKPTTTSSSSSGGGDGSSEGWCGSVSQLQLSAYPPDAGPVTATPAEGVVTIGAVPWVTNYNVPLHTGDMAAAKAVARAVSSKGGGLPGVEAMALPHGPGVIEIATNLIAYDWRAAASSSTGQKTGSDGSSRQSPPGGSSSGIVQGQDGSWEVEQLAGAGPAEVAAAVAREAQRLGLPPPGPGYITNKTPPELIAAAAERLQC